MEGSPMGIIEDNSEFLANDSVLGGDLNGYEWIRLADIKCLEGAKVFADEIKADDVTQGNLGNCYFVSALSKLAEKPERVKNLFESLEVSYDGKYKVKMLKDGIWTSILVDDMIPSKEGELVFGYSRANDLWVPLVEKAAAKKFGSYKRLESGHAIEPMADMTGAATMRLKPTDEICWSYLLEAE